VRAGQARVTAKKATTATRNRSPEDNVSPADAGTRTVVIPDHPTGRQSPIR
jgi:hypothetical protein